MILTFHFNKDISDEDREALLAEAEKKIFIKLILKMLSKADDFYRSIKLGNYELDSINISLGLVPGISLSFKKIS